MATIQDWLDFVDKLPKAAPFIKVCMETEEIPIDIPIPIPKLMFPPLPIPSFSFDSLLGGLPPPPSIIPGEGQLIKVKVPIPTLVGGAPSGPPSLEDLVGGLFSSLLSAMGGSESVPQIELPSYTLPELSPELLQLIQLSIEQCPEGRNQKYEVEIPGADLLRATTETPREFSLSTGTDFVESEEEDPLTTVIDELSEITLELKKISEERGKERVEYLRDLGYPVYESERKLAGELI